VAVQAFATDSGVGQLAPISARWPSITDRRLAGECPVAASPRVAGVPAGRLVWDHEQAPVLRRACNNTKMAAGDPFTDVVVWAGASDWS